MVDLQQFQAKVCLTAGGCLIYDNQVLLIKHKKAGWWVNPGGHIEDGELPHQTAEREFWEETGIKVKAMSVNQVIDSAVNEYLPNPFTTALQWACKENYDCRVHGQKREKNNPWHRGCEQHLNVLYLVEPVDTVEFSHNNLETDGIAWFKREKITHLETDEDIKKEIALAFQYYDQCTQHQKP